MPSWAFAISQSDSSALGCTNIEFEHPIFASENRRDRCGQGGNASKCVFRPDAVSDAVDNRPSYRQTYMYTWCRKSEGNMNACTYSCCLGWKP